MPNNGSLYAEHLEIVKQRTERALEETGYDHILIFAGDQHMIFLDDMPYEFRVNAHFKYWIPVDDNPNCWLLYSPGRKPVVFYYQPVDYWHKPAETPTAEWVDHVDLRMIRHPDEISSQLPRGKTAFVGEWSPRFGEWELTDANPDSLVNRLHFDRAWKTEWEKDNVRRASERGVRGHLAAAAAFRAGESEFGIHIAYLEATGHTEAELPYGNIIALNENAAVLHYQHQSRENPAERRSFLIDAGASWNGYACDITRTWSGGDPDFQEFIDSVEQMQEDLCAMVKPGLDYRELHFETHRKVGGILADHGFVEMAPDTMVQENVTSFFFPHGVGHYLGLQVHDVGGFMANREGESIPKPEGHPFLRLTRLIDKDQVFTVEPGIYFIESLLAELKNSKHSSAVVWDKVDRFRKFGGVRIEDDLIVTEDGHENATRDAWTKLAS